MIIVVGSCSSTVALNGENVDNTAYFRISHQQLHSIVFYGNKIKPSPVSAAVTYTPIEKTEQWNFNLAQM